ncbi:radical SAM/SPASM domain-containing protein [Bacillus cereus group sp. MYBKT14-1]|uniref:radical SAM/SPASM domain-containing protein n=1 Tax=Bacillus TaxID=1386 RepID=UPI000BEBD275|nr:MULTISPECIES: radical SAM protein [Bacillus]MDM5370295.1 radical SAM protein [Bacillus bombysepticus]MRD38716.1 radical SAM protein [Bacillus thuringiensis]MBC6976060.1 radical SAM protein [Bacillus sp. Xin]MDA2236485.1 radical SAM protein [Bacillus cereus]MEB9440228.1 radical SAM protein [Bacillus cereus]
MLPEVLTSKEHLEQAKQKIEVLWAKGTDFSKEEVEAAKADNRMLLLDMDFTSECKLHCYYCDRTPDRFNKGERQPLTTEDRKSLILQAKELGARTVEFPGSGEPMIDEGFWEVIEFIHKNEMTPVIFTSGWHLDDESIDRLYNLGATIFLKYNSTSQEINDDIVKVKGYGAYLEKILEKLVVKGFTKSIPTRLAIDLVVTPRNEDFEDIERIFRWCRRNNVHNYITTLIPEGIADKKSKLFEKERANSFINRLKEIDEKEFGITYNPSLPMAGGYKCRQVNVGMFVNLYGEVYDCNGLGRFLGHIRINNLKEIWNSKFATHVRAEEQEGYCAVRERVWDETNLKGFDRKMEDYNSWEENNTPDEVVLKGLYRRENPDKVLSN